MWNRVSICLPLTFLLACGGTQKPQPQPVEAPPPRPAAAPSGPTQTDFKALARRLVGRCAMGGWIERWRSTHPDPDVAKPRVYLPRLTVETDKDFDEGYLRDELEQRMRLSGVYEMVSDETDADFVARGRVRRMAERVGGERVPVFVSSIELHNRQTGKVAHRCEAVVRDES